MSFHYDPRLPKTDELPVVRQPPPPGRWLLRALVALLLVSGAVVAAVVLFPEDDADGPPTAMDAAGDGTDAPPEPDGEPEPEIVELPDAGAGTVTVFDVNQFLNVRSGPGTSHPVIGTLALGEQVRATGERVTVNGSEWKQVDLGDRGGVGWVSGRFVTDEPIAVATPTNTPTDAPAKTTVCLKGTTAGVTRTVRIDFGDGDAIAGLVRTDTSGRTRFATMEGELRSGVATVVLTDRATEREVRDRWTFRPADVILGDASDSPAVPVVPCASVEALLR